MPAMSSWADFPARPLIMGVLNVTPDSFSDGGDHLDPATAIAAAHRMAQDGADIIDIGGESTRPGTDPTPPDVEQARILPVIRALAALGIPLSVDTRNAATMAAALDAGAAIINDVSGLLHDPASAPLLARRACLLVLMHMRGTPATMNSLAHYTDVSAEVAAELATAMAAAEHAGIDRARIALDPGIGFAKTGDHNVALLRNLRPVLALGCPVLIGVSRKRFIGTLAGEPDPRRRSAGSVAAGLFALSQGATILRTHDVAETVQAVRVWSALAG